MKTINSKKKKFSGVVSIGSQKVFINTTDGTGFYKTFQLMEPAVRSLSHFGLSCCPWSTYDDMKQDIYLLIIEGIPKYNPDKGASLPTFLCRFIKNKILDRSRDRDPIRGRFRHLVVYDDTHGIYYDPLHLEDKIDLMKKIECLDNKWRCIIFRLFIINDRIADVANDEQMTPWGLTRAVRKKIAEIKKF